MLPATINLEAEVDQANPAVHAGDAQLGEIENALQVLSAVTAQHAAEAEHTEVVGPVATAEVPESLYEPHATQADVEPATPLEVVATSETPLPLPETHAWEADVEPAAPLEVVAATETPLPLPETHALEAGVEPATPLEVVAEAHAFEAGVEPAAPLEVVAVSETPLPLPEAHALEADVEPATPPELVAASETPLPLPEAHALEAGVEPAIQLALIEFTETPILPELQATETHASPLAPEPPALQTDLEPPAQLELVAASETPVPLLEPAPLESPSTIETPLPLTDGRSEPEPALQSQPVATHLQQLNEALASVAETSLPFAQVESAAPRPPAPRLSSTPLDLTPQLAIPHVPLRELPIQPVDIALRDLPPVYSQSKRKAGVPSWAITMVAAVVITLVVASVVQKLSSSEPAANAAAPVATKRSGPKSTAHPHQAFTEALPSEAAPTKTAAPDVAPQLEAHLDPVPETPPAPPAILPAPVNEYPYARFVEVASLKVVEQNNRPQVQYFVVNNAERELDDIALRITVRSSIAAPGTSPLFTVAAWVPKLAPHQSKEIRTDLDTGLTAAQIPKPEQLRTEVRVTSQQ